MFFWSFQSHLVSQFSSSCSLFLPSICSCNAITALRSASVAIIHVITTQLPRKQCFPHEARFQRWQTFQIRRPLTSICEGDGGGWGTLLIKQDEVLLTGRWVSTLPFLQGDIIDCNVALDARSPDAF